MLSKPYDNFLANNQYLTMVEIQLLDRITNNEQILNHLKDDFQNSKKQYKIGRYRILAQLDQGEGAFGKVFKGLDMESARSVAIKIIDIEKLMYKYPSYEIQQKIKRYLRDEELLMKKCHSAFVVKLYEAFENTKCKVLVMEYCRHGGLDRFISERGALEEEDAVIILRQLILGLSELHRNSIIHRDLKPANILVHNGLFKIADFGLSKQIIEDVPEEQSQIDQAKLKEQQQDPTVCGSKNTMAPEVKNRQIYGLKADIWLLGMIYFMMVYPKKTLNERYLDANKIFMYKGDFQFRTITDRPLSEHSADFLKSTLVEESLRMNWEQTLEHPLFKTRFERMPSVYLPGLDDAFEDLKDKKEKLDDKKVVDVQKGIIDFEKLKAQSEKMLTDSVRQDQLLQHLDVELLNQQYLECRISESIYYEIINPILTKNMLSNKRFHAQFVFLLLNRCRENIICAREIVNTKYPQEIAEKFCKQVKELLDMVSAKFDEVTMTLKAIEDKFSQIIKDRISRLFYRQSYKEKEKFLNCFERQQFMKEEQLSYTYKEYIPRIVNEIKGESIQQEEKMKGLIKSYKEINEIKLSSLGTKRIQQEIQSIITKNL